MSELAAVDKAIAIRAETLLADPDTCKFTVSRSVSPLMPSTESEVGLRVSVLVSTCVLVEMLVEMLVTVLSPWLTAAYRVAETSTPAMMMAMASRV